MERKLRILMISPQFRPIVGGYERAAERLSQALVEMGHEVEVITERRSMMWPRTETIAGFRIRRLWCVYHRGLHIATSLLAFTLYLVLHGRRFDVWHVHQYGMHAALCVLMGKLLRRPVGLKLTSSGSMGIAVALQQKRIPSILAWCHRQIGACIATTSETRTEAMRFGIPLERIHLIPNGVDGRQFHPASPEPRAAARKALGLDCDRIVLNIGRMSAEKNHLGLLDAWGKVDIKVREGAMLVLVGEGQEFDAVRVRAQMPDLADSVYLPGMQNDTATWYQAADFYVIPSHYKGLSNTMIEALASGLPVISTNVSGSSILLEPPISGQVVNVGNIEQLADAIKVFLQSEAERTRFGINARLIFQTCFSMENVTKEMIALYEDLRNQNENRGRV